MQIRPEQLEQFLRQGLSSCYLVTGAEPLIVQECADAIRVAAREQGCVDRERIDTSDKAGWPKRTQSLSHGKAREIESDVASLVLRLSGPEQPGAYRADWAPDRMGPQTHYGYAVQWFSLAIALVILTVVASYRKTGVRNHNDNG